MKKFIASFLVAFAILIGSNVAGASAAQAQVHPTSSVSVIQAAPGVIGGTGGGIKPVWRYVSCYWGIDGAKYCWRYSCTYFEKVALGCYDGWYRVTNWYA